MRGRTVVKHGQRCNVTYLSHQASSGPCPYKRKPQRGAARKGARSKAA